MILKLPAIFLTTNFVFALANLNEIMDLSWDFSNETIYWEGVTSFTYTKVVESETRGYWYSAKEFCAGEHGGTHFDSPYHFNKQGWKVADVPLSRLITKGAVIDLSHNYTESLLTQHLEDWVGENGKFENNTLLLIKFGMSRFWPNRRKYMKIDDDGRKNFPGISAEAATWIANNGNIVGVGLDTPSVDRGTSSDMLTHRILSKSQIYNIENVKILGDLPVKGFTVLVLPMKLKDGTGAPVRVLAVPNGLV